MASRLDLLKVDEWCVTLSNRYKAEHGPTAKGLAFKENLLHEFPMSGSLRLHWRAYANAYCAAILIATSLRRWRSVCSQPHT